MGKRLTYLAVVVVACMFAVPAMAKDKKQAGAKDKQRDPEAMFKAKDTDGDSKLSVEEFVGKAKGDRAEKAKAQFAKLDADGDGSLTLDEFKAGMGHHKGGKGGKKKGHEKENNGGDNQ